MSYPDTAVNPLVSPQCQSRSVVGDMQCVYVPGHKGLHGACDSRGYPCHWGNQMQTGWDHTPAQPVEVMPTGFVIAKENQVFGLHEADIDAAWAEILDSKEGRCADGVKPIVFARRIDAMNMLHALEWLHKSELENVVVVLPWPFNPGCR